MKKLVLLTILLFLSCSIPQQPDDSVPVTFILYPVDGQAVDGVIDISFAAGDNDKVDRVDLYIDESIVNSWTSEQTNYRYSWDTSSLTDGSVHFLSVIARDKEGNIGYSGNIRVTKSASQFIDDLPPSITLSYPVAGQTFSDTLNVLVFASDNIGVQRLEIYTNGLLNQTLTQAPFNTQLDFSSLPDGSSITLTVVGYDAAGNSSNTIPVTVTKQSLLSDNLAPSAAIVYPVSGSTLDVPISILTDVNDNGTIQTVQLFDNGNLISSDNSAPYSFNFNIQNYAYGSRHDLLVKAIDNAGNAGYSSTVTVTREENIYTPPDQTAPVVTILNPVEGDSLSVNTTIIVDVTDASAIQNVEFIIDGVSELVDSSAPWEYTLNISGYNSGEQHSVFVKATDIYNNVGTAYQVLLIR